MVTERDQSSPERLFQQDLAGDIIPIDDRTWAIHGRIPVDGDVIVAEFERLENAEAVLGALRPDPVDRGPSGAATDQLPGSIRVLELPVSAEPLSPLVRPRKIAGMATLRGSRPRVNRSLHAPEGQSVTFVELFFDLVFVFAITQVTAVTAEHLDAQGILRGLLIFWLVWWAWTQFTWTLNPADTRHVAVQVVTLLATAAAFVMASSVSLAFGDEALWFAIPYVVVRILGLGLQVRIAREASVDDGGSPTPVTTWVALSSLGLVAVLIGALLPNPARAWIWVLAIALDVAAAAIGAASDQPWDLSAAHLAERHGLFVIIAIGESLIIAGSAAADESRSLEFIALAGAGLAVVGLLWWSYFAWFKDDLEEAFASVEPGHRGRVARDAYSLSHFPLVGGIVAFAIAAELMVAHPDDPVEAATIAALGAGVILFMGATVFSYWRVHRRVLVPRLTITLATAALLALVVDARPVWPLAIAAAGLAVIAVVERSRLPGRR